MADLIDDTDIDGVGDLWEVYREASPDPEGVGDREFLPNLWQRIEAKRLETESTIRHFARLSVAIGVTSTILIASASHTIPDDDYSFSTYVSLLVADQVDEDVMQGIVLPLRSNP